MAFDPQEYYKNRQKMKWIERIYSGCFKVCIFYLVIAIFSFITSILSTPNDLTLALIFSGLILPIAYEALTLPAMKNKKTIFLIIAPVFTAAAAIIGDELDSLGALNGIFTFINLIVSVILIIANNLYNELSLKEGFPYFSELVEYQKEEKRKFEEENPYEKRYQQIIQNSSENMFELTSDIGASSDLGTKEDKMDEI